MFIKPNLTWKRPIPGVTVTPAFLRALVEALLPATRNITIGEAEGGQACFQAEEAFESHGLYDLQREYGIRVVNLSKCPHETARARVGGDLVAIDLPSLLLREIDVFITVPVPKVHAMTRVSLAFKNQWGCLGDKMRVTQHPRFAPVILAINKLLRPRLCFCDGTYFLDHTGPMTGEPIPMNLLVAADDIGAASLACCEVMRIDPMGVPHYRLARAEGMFPRYRREIEFNRPPEQFAGRRFRLRRSAVNYVQLAAFKIAALNRASYDSAWADPIHEALWWLRRNRLVRRFLYGRYGPCEANRGGRIV